MSPRYRPGFNELPVSDNDEWPAKLRTLRSRSLKGAGFKSNYHEVESGDPYWISGPHKDRDDRLYGGNRGVEIDEDVRDEYVALISRG